MSMISKQIDELRTYAKDRKGELAKLINDAADTIETLFTKLSASNLERSSQYYHGGWIPCSERLPEDVKKEYWVCTDTGHQCTCRWTNINHFWTDLTTDWHWNIFDVPMHSRVIAWMPLPEPYRGGVQE